MKTKRQSPNSALVKDLGIRATQAEHDLLSYAAVLSKRPRVKFVLFHAIEAAKEILAENNVDISHVPASKPWK